MVGDELQVGGEGILEGAVVVVVGERGAPLVSSFGRHFVVVVLVGEGVWYHSPTVVGLCVLCPDPVQ